jgi:hypothetical protein
MNYKEYLNKCETIDKYVSRYIDDYMSQFDDLVMSRLNYEDFLKQSHPYVLVYGINFSTGKLLFKLSVNESFIEFVFKMLEKESQEEERHEKILICKYCSNEIVTDEDQYYECTSCEYAVCSDCMDREKITVCTCCNDYTCEDCMDECNQCGEDTCIDCLENGVCVVCSEED